MRWDRLQSNEIKKNQDFADLVITQYTVQYQLC